MIAEALSACAAGVLAPNVALARLLVAAPSPEAVEAAVEAERVRWPAGSPEHRRLEQLAGLRRETPCAWAKAKAILGHVASKNHARSPADWASVFDHAARISPEAGVALYSLGRSDLLEAATQSIVARLDEWGLLGPGRHALDLGCGSGRMIAALAPHLRAIVGIDVSEDMLAVARRRCRDLANVQLLATAGRDLAPFPDAAFDLVLAVDVFPYLVASGDGLVRRHFEECRRVLADGGTLVILNYAYGSTWDDDVTAVRRGAEAARLNVVRTARNDFAFWDGATFLLEREH